MTRHRTTFVYIAICIILDQGTKQLFYNQKRLHNLFVPVLNTGAARSMPIPEWIILSVGIVISIYLTTAFIQKNIHRTASIFFLAGIRGNIIDRISYDGVRDFITIGDRFPIFNLADIYITGAVIFLIRYELSHNKTQ